MPPGGTTDSAHFSSEASTCKRGLGIVIDDDTFECARMEGPSAGATSSVAAPPEGTAFSPTGALGVPHIFSPRFVPGLTFLAVIGVFGLGVIVMGSCFAYVRVPLGCCPRGARLMPQSCLLLLCGLHPRSSLLRVGQSPTMSVAPFPKVILSWFSRRRWWCCWVPNLRLW